jgi:flavin-binding protein dodecin
MSIAKVTEIKVSSPKSFEDAIQEGINRANKTLKNVKSAWIKDFEVEVDDKGKISEYRILMKVTFILTD